VRLDVLGQHEHADAGVGPGDLGGGLQSFGGVGRGNADVDDRGIWGSRSTSRSSSSADPTLTVTVIPALVSRLATPARNSTASSAIATRMATRI
jgi:hypothetical protein